MRMKLLDDNFMNRTKKTKIDRPPRVKGPSKKERIEEVAEAHARDLHVTRFYHWGSQKQGNTQWSLLNDKITEGDIEKMLTHKPGPTATEQAGRGFIYPQVFRTQLITLMTTRETVV